MKAIFLCGSPQIHKTTDFITKDKNREIFPVRICFHASHRQSVKVMVSAGLTNLWEDTSDKKHNGSSMKFMF